MVYSVQLHGGASGLSTPQLRISENSASEPMSQKPGDTVSISPEAKNKAGRVKLEKEDTEESSATKEPSDTNYIERRIQEIKEEIKKIQEDDSLSEEEKQRRIEMLNQELMQLLTELKKQKKGGPSALSGTPAEGFASSLT